MPMPDHDDPALEIGEPTRALGQRTQAGTHDRRPEQQVFKVGLGVDT
jgi:hypothetical protein